MKQLVFLALLASFGGCSNFKFSAAICDKIAQDPNTQTLPQECRVYDKKAAQRAYFNKKKKPTDVKDIIQFQQDKEQN